MSFGHLNGHWAETNKMGIGQGPTNLMGICKGALNNLYQGALSSLYQGAFSRLDGHMAGNNTLNGLMA